MITIELKSKIKSTTTQILKLMIKIKVTTVITTIKSQKHA